jgi:hypothetical protein
MAMGWYAHRHCKRKGHNLVLHMNFSNQHDTIYQHTFRFPKSSPFCWGGHPRNRQGRNTLAWTRLDIDMDQGDIVCSHLVFTQRIGNQSYFYNTWKTDCRMKGISERWAPPHSIYTDLPRRFCFKKTEEYPAMIYKRARYVRRKWKNDTPYWFKLAG